MTTTTRLHAVIILIFSFVFIVSALSFWQLSLHDVALETEAAMKSAETLMQQNTSAQVLHETIASTRHLKISMQYHPDALSYTYAGARYYILPDKSAELEEIYITIGLFFGLFSLALALTLVSVTRVIRAKESTIMQIQQQLVHIQEQERQRLAMELHDNVGQIISGIHVNAFMLQESEEASSTVTSIADNISVLCEQVQQETKQLVNTLHPVMLQRLGFTQALEQMISLANENNPVQVILENNHSTWQDNEDRDIQLFRICQEAVQNAIKHAEATMISCVIHAINQQTEIVIKDNGKGFNKNTIITGVGFHSMQERARIAECKLSIIGQPAIGTAVKISF